jgi:DNA-binding response OmpR family regulator
MKKIIFTDDDPTIRDIIELILGDSYELKMYSSGEPLMTNGFDLPDLFLLDRQLSGVDGLDVCRFLKSQEETKHIPVIIISATSNVVRHALQAGADDVIEKPFLIAELRKMIARHLS